MADNVQANLSTSSGPTFASDDISSVHYPICKLAFGALNTATLVTTTDGFPVQVVSVIPGTGATNLGKAVDSAAGATDSGVAPLAVRDDALSALTPIEGDYVQLRVDANGALWVTPTSSSSGTEYTEGATDSSITGVALMLEGAADTLIAAPGTAADGMLVNLGGNNDVTVTGSVTANAGTNLNTSALALETGGNLAACATSLGTLDNAISGNEMQVDVVGALPAGTNNIGDVDVASIAAGDNNIGNVDVVTVPTDPFGANADAASATGSISAKLRFIAATGIPVTNTVTVGTHAVTQSGTWNIGTVTTVSTVTTCSTVTTVSTLTGGGVAHDSADSGNPHKIGLKAESSPKGITLVADADRTDWYADVDGIAVVKQNTSNDDVISERVSNTDGNSTAFTNFGAVASTHNCITGFHVFRTDAGTTPIYVDFRDGTAGAILWSVVIPAGGGANNPPYCGPFLFRTSQNTALALDVSAATTTVYISVSGYASKA